MPNLMVHGRFQPFHLEHLSYVLEGLRRSDSFVVVGITNPYPVNEPEAGYHGDPHRHDLAANPYSFVQRARMVQRSLADKGVAMDCALVIPLHLDRLAEHAGLAGDVEQLVNVLDEWDDEKCRRFSDAGFRVNRFHRPRTVSATEIRRLLGEGATISHLVPAGTLSVLAEV